MDVDEFANTIERIVRAIEPLLAGKGPEVQGASLMILTAKWLSGYRACPFEVEALLLIHTEQIRRYAAKLALEQMDRGER